MSESNGILSSGIVSPPSPKDKNQQLASYLNNNSSLPDEEDYRDGFVYFGCKNSVHISNSNSKNPEMTNSRQVSPLLNFFPF